ncbi:MAG: DUF1707 SHOCT-like domain-containing protein [Solirubrobacteraceae bacterium]
MASRASLRASDDDRERVVERLRGAAAEGRLVSEELEQRIGLALVARTYGELEVTVADLPGPGLARRRTRGLPLAHPVLTLAITIPVAVAVIAATVLLVTGLLATWMLWALAAWWFFGHRRGACRAGYGRSRSGYSRRPALRYPDPQPERGPWV